jgi:[ribosomal protein S18]-alanine N-acetyltransferase
MLNKIHLRGVEVSDLDSIMRIERASFDSPWSRKDFIRCMTSDGGLGAVAQCGTRIVGFSIIQKRRSTVELLNLAVDPAYRRRGVATALVDNAMHPNVVGRRNRIGAIVWERNLVAQLFFREMGFLCVRTISGHWHTWNDEQSYRFVFHVRRSQDELCAGKATDATA